MEKEGMFFVEVSQSDEVKRNILESLKEIVENLQRFEKFKETRKEKIENIEKLGKIMKEINKIVPQLREALPETKIRSKKVSKGEQKKTVAVEEETPREIAKRKPVTELQKLESELSEIEGKLRSLR